jgi:hypothetical protein
MSTFSSIFGGGSIDYWVSGTTYAQGKTVRSPANHQLYVRIVAGAGTTDPASDSTNWRADGRTAVKARGRGIINITGGNLTATATITAVDTAKTELRYLGCATEVAGTDAHIYLTNTTTITATRKSNGGGLNTAVSYEFVEYY